MQRNDATATIMHNITYSYPDNQNRLNSINATGLNSSNYLYDRLGNLTRDGGEGITIAWNTSGKVKSVTGGSSLLDFSYSALGQRQIKAYLTEGGKASDYYIHDATGNVMAIYTLSDNYSRFQLKERHIYGSSRLGIYQRDIGIYPSEEVIPLSFTRGLKRYELSNHLGNVISIFSDRKRQGKVGFYTVDHKGHADYYPFGYQMPQRTVKSADYRFGFNGQEKDDEIYGEGNSTTAEYWQYDARLGRRWNVDPVQHPSLSSYSVFADNPIIYSDIFGLDTIYRTQDGTEYSRYPGGNDNFYIEIAGPIEVANDFPDNKRNPYPSGSLPYQVFENNRNNPNLWLNKARFSWQGYPKSQWMKDFDRGFGWMLPTALLTPFVGYSVTAGLELGVIASGEIPLAITTTRIAVRRFYSYIASRSIRLGLKVANSDMILRSQAYIYMLKGNSYIQLGTAFIMGYFIGGNLPYDFSTGIIPFDIGIQLGTAIDWYEKEIIKMIYENKDDKEKDSN